MKNEYTIIYNIEQVKNRKIKGVYFIRNLDNDYVKIGMTKDIFKRYKKIKNDFKFCGINPNLQLEVIIECEDYKEVETWLHIQLKDFKYINEWYEVKNVEKVIKFFKQNYRKENYKKNIKNIKEKPIIKNTYNLELKEYKYSELCEIMGWEKVKGNSKKSQYKILDTICKYHLEGCGKSQKIVIDEVYDDIKEKIDNRKYNKNQGHSTWISRRKNPIQ